MKAAALLLCACLAAPAAAADEAANGGAAYLALPFGARAAGMGRAGVAVQPAEAGAMHLNSALPALLQANTLSFANGTLGLGRTATFAGYALPFRPRKGKEESWCASEILDNSLTPNERNAARQAAVPAACAKSANLPRGGAEPGQRRWKSSLSPAAATDMTLSVGLAQLGIGGLGGRSEYGAPEADFKDTERAVFIQYSGRPYDNLALGVGVKQLSQKLADAKAAGMAIDLGLWYGVPRQGGGELTLGAALKDLGAELEWKLTDPYLGEDFSYKEKVPARTVVGAAYTSSGGAWLAAADIEQAAGRALELRAGLEWRPLPALFVRAGLSGSNPTAGFSWAPAGRSGLRLDYAFEQDIEGLYSPHWATLTLRFSPRPAAR